MVSPKITSPKIVNSKRYGLHPVIKLLILITLFVAVTHSNNLSQLTLHTILLFGIFFALDVDMLGILKSIKAVSFLLLLVLLYSFVLFFTSNNLYYALTESFTKTYIILLIFFYSYIFVTTTRRTDLIKTVSIFLFPFRAFIGKDEIFLIQHHTMKLIPIILQSAKQEFTAHFSGKNKLNALLAIHIPITNLFSKHLCSSYHTPFVSKKRISVLMSFRKPQPSDVIMLVVFLGVCIGIDYIQ
jgi:energy-coupling factor transporter transmembrane protein EcfT